MNEHDDSVLLAAIERNTSAVRAIAVFLFGGVLWFLIGAVFLGLGVVGLNINRYDPTPGSVFVGIGSLLILVGAIWSIAGALRELAKSRV